MSLHHSNTRHTLCAILYTIYLSFSLFIIYCSNSTICSQFTGIFLLCADFSVSTKRKIYPTGVWTYAIRANNNNQMRNVWYKLVLEKHNWHYTWSAAQVFECSEMLLFVFAFFQSAATVAAAVHQNKTNNRIQPHFWALFFSFCVSVLLFFRLLYFNGRKTNFKIFSAPIFSYPISTISFCYGRIKRWNWWKKKNWNANSRKTHKRCAPSIFIR